MTSDDLFTAPSAARDVLSVSQVNRRSKQLLETHLPLLWIEGELSNLAFPSSGHWYFTLKDANAQIRGCMFRNRNQMVRFTPEHGQQVVVRARISLYEGRGDYQLIAEHIEIAGTGALQYAFEALKQRLAAEGLFAEQHKQTLPKLPKHIGVITSATGAALADILHVLARRFAGIPVTFIPVAVQGKEAAGQIVKAIALANRSGLFDVLIVGRGGGSLEDLWPFNEEAVARAIFASRVPIVSAVGHEVDFTIADFVADVRAPTPSAAAELITPDGDSMLDQFIGLEVLLEDAIASRIRQDRKQIQHLRARLRHPKDKLQQQSQRLDHLETQLTQSAVKALTHQRQRLERLALRLQAQHPATRVAQLAQRISRASSQLYRLQKQQQQQFTTRLGAAVHLLNTLNPLNTLARGYSLVKSDNHQVITDSAQLHIGEIIRVKLAKGELSAQVKTTQS